MKKIKCKDERKLIKRVTEKESKIEKKKSYMKNEYKKSIKMQHPINNNE